MTGEATASHGLTRGQLRDKVRSSRAAQGLPATVEDPAVLARIAELAARHDIDDTKAAS